MKLDRARVFGRFARDLSGLSKCTDRQVAAIITDADGKQVYSIGLNGGFSGGLDCLCNLGVKQSCIHAEMNAIAKCTAADPNKVIFCTLAPCITCAALIANTGITTVYWLEDYKDDLGIRLLQSRGIACYKLELDDKPASSGREAEQSELERISKGVRK